MTADSLAKNAANGDLAKLQADACNVFVVLSQCSVSGFLVPDGIENNKWNVFIAKSSPPNVSKTYAKQFQEDLSLFLRMRSEEIKPGGHMFFTLMGRGNPNPSGGWELLAESLCDLGLVKEADLDSFNIPQYTPYKEEASEIIQDEASFELIRLEVFEVDRDKKEDVNNNDFVLDKGKKFADSIRAITEHLLACHFGDAIIDTLFERLAMHQVDHPDPNDDKVVNIVVSMTKK
ncbi:hypothetical protein PTKIN_Ptkin08bG0187800 [Pterospermum kingtungense]